MPKKIKLTAYRSKTKQWEELFPEDEFFPDQVVPFFQSADGNYYTVPDVKVDQPLTDEWLAQFEPKR